jgi:hypothetical protein
MAVVMAAAITAASGARAGGAEAPADEAVRALWSAVDARFDARDADGFSALFTTDASFVRVKSNEALEGRAAILADFATRFPRFAPEVRHRTSMRPAMALAPGLLGADGTVEILRRSPGGGAELAVARTFSIFAVMVREGTALKVRALRIYELPAKGAGAPQ